MADCCRHVVQGLACYTAADNSCQTLFATTVLNCDGTPVAIYYTDAQGAVVDTSAGTLTLGQCEPCCTCPELPPLGLITDLSLLDA